MHNCLQTDLSLSKWREGQNRGHTWDQQFDQQALPAQSHAATNANPTISSIPTEPLVKPDRCVSFSVREFSLATLLPCKIQTIRDRLSAWSKKIGDMDSHFSCPFPRPWGRGIHLSTNTAEHLHPTSSCQQQNLWNRYTVQRCSSPKAREKTREEKP